MSGTYVPSAALKQAGQKFTGQITVGLVVVRLPSGVVQGHRHGRRRVPKTTFAVNIGGGGGSARRISWRELIQR